VTLKGQTRDPNTLRAQYLENSFELETSNLVCSFVLGMQSRSTNNFPETGRGLGHVTPTIFCSTVGYPSDSLASCYNKKIRDWRKRRRGREGERERKGKGNGRKRKEGREERKREKEKRDEGGTSEKCEAPGCIR